MKPLLASGVAENRFQDHNPASTYMNSAYQLKMSECHLSCGLHQLDINVPRLQTSIGQQSFAFYGPIMWNNLPTVLAVLCVTVAWNRTGLNGSWKIIFFDSNNTTLGVSVIKGGYSLTPVILTPRLMSYVCRTTGMRTGSVVQPFVNRVPGAIYKCDYSLTQYLKC